MGEGRWEAGDAPEAVEPADGEKMDGTDEDGPPVQAETDAETRTVAVAQPAAVSLALLTFIETSLYTRLAAALNPHDGKT